MILYGATRQQTPNSLNEQTSAQTCENLTWNAGKCGSKCTKAVGDAASHNTSEVRDAKNVIVRNPVRDAKNVVVRNPVRDAKNVVVRNPVRDAKNVVVRNPVRDAKNVVS